MSKHVDKQSSDAIIAKQAGIVATLEILEIEADASEYERQTERLSAKLKSYAEYLARHNLTHAKAPRSEYADVVARLMDAGVEAASRHLDWMRRRDHRYAKAKILALMPPQVLLPKETALVQELLEAVEETERERLEFVREQAREHYERVGVIPRLPLR